MSEPLVIVGNGMAAARLVDELAKTALGRYAVAVIGEEPRLAYNRVLLSSVLAGETGSHEIELKPAGWWRDRGVTVRYGYRATEIDVGRRELKIAGEESMEFSKLVLATVVGGLSNLQSILPAASALAKRHVAYGARAEHYPVVGAALLWTLEKGLGEAWTPELATAWTDVYGVLSGYMISEAYGAQAQAAE